MSRDPNAAPRGKCFGVFRLTHVATVQPLTVACRHCVGLEFCQACKGTGRHAVRKPMPQPATVRVGRDFDRRDDAEKLARSIDWRLGAIVDVVTPGGAS